MPEAFRYVLIKTKAGSLVVLDLPAAEQTNVPLPRYEVLSRHRSWEAANAARGLMEKKQK